MATLLYPWSTPAKVACTGSTPGIPRHCSWPGDDPPHFLERGGSVPLGVLPFPTYEQMSAEMKPGTTVVLYTDGLIERPGEHLDDGMAQLAARVREAAENPEPSRAPAGHAVARGRGHRRRRDPRP